MAANATIDEIIDDNDENLQLALEASMSDAALVRAAPPASGAPAASGEAENTTTT